MHAPSCELIGEKELEQPEGLEWKNHVNNAGRTAAESFNAAYRFNKDKQEWHLFAAFLDKFMAPPRKSPLPAPAPSLPKAVTEALVEAAAPSASESSTSPLAQPQPCRGVGGELQEKLQNRHYLPTKTLHFEHENTTIANGVCKLIYTVVSE